MNRNRFDSVNVSGFPYCMEIEVEPDRLYVHTMWLTKNIGPEYKKWLATHLYTDTTRNIRHWKIHFTNEEDRFIFIMGCL